MSSSGLQGAGKHLENCDEPRAWKQLVFLIANTYLVGKNPARNLTESWGVCCTFGRVEMRYRCAALMLFYYPLYLFRNRVFI